jgi:DNA-binding HxlR family transcriptional regulator
VYLGCLLLGEGVGEMSSYGQFCPVPKAMELLDERWTMLVVRELVSGSSRFNDLRRGVPRMSPALLSKRLQSLTRAGVVQRGEVDGRASYTLTPCGRELAEVLQAVGSWGVRWIGDLGDKDLDPHLLMWDLGFGGGARGGPADQLLAVGPRARRRRIDVVLSRFAIGHGAARAAPAVRRPDRRASPSRRWTAAGWTT